MKNLKDISWQVSEPEYRADPALSYSTLAKFAREGFNNLDTLFDKVESPSLLFGSAVDALITGGEEEFSNNFVVASIKPVGPAIKSIVDALFEKYSDTYRYLLDLPNEVIIEETNIHQFQTNWKPETRARVIKEQGAQYYQFLFLSDGKTIIDTFLKKEIDDTVYALKNSPTTKFYFGENHDDLIRDYQLKFKATLEGIDYRCMADLIITDHKYKTIYPIDLKTSSHTEWDFAKSFIQWRYDIQARLYWRIIRDNMDRDEQFKDYTLMPYVFIVANKKTKTPLKWIFKKTHYYGPLEVGTLNPIFLEDPFTLGKDLTYYLKNKPAVPKGISQNSENDIEEWLNKNI